MMTDDREKGTAGQGTPVFTEEELDRLLRYAGKRLDTSPEALKAAFDRDGLYGLAQQAAAAPTLTGQEAAAAEALLRDPQQLDRLIASPQLQRMLAELLGRQ